MVFEDCCTALLLQRTLVLTNSVETEKCCSINEGSLNPNFLKWVWKWRKCIFRKLYIFKISYLNSQTYHSMQNVLKTLSLSSLSKMMSSLFKSHQTTNIILKFWEPKLHRLDLNKFSQQVLKPRSFPSTFVIKTGISDFHRMTASVLKNTFLQTTTKIY